MNIYERFALNTAARTARGCDWLTGERLDIMAARKKADSYAADKKALDEYRSLPNGDAEQASAPEAATDNMGFDELDLSPFGATGRDAEQLFDGPKEEPGPDIALSGRVLTSKEHAGIGAGGGDDDGYPDGDVGFDGPGPSDIDGPPVLSDPELPKVDPAGSAPEPSAAAPSSAAASSPASVPKRARRPLLSSEVNKAERKLLSFEDRKRSFYDTAQRHAAQVDSEQVAFIEALPDAVRTSLKLMGLIQA